MLKLDDELDQVTVAKTYRAEQEHVFRFWDQLDEGQRRALLDQLGGIDLQQLGRLVKEIDPPEDIGDWEPVPPQRFDGAQREQLAAKGWEALSAGRVACLVVAGGQGTRLGWPHPKGTYAVGPASGNSLFQLFAEQLLATGRRAGKPLDLYVLTSRHNKAETEAFFSEREFFGLDPAQVTFLVQGELPNTDPRGKLLLAEKHQVAMSPNGHGGSFLALRDHGALERMAERGQDLLFYWQVDNALCRVADPAFVGAHLDAGAEASTKVVKKTDPAEKVGLLALKDGKTRVVEYSELSEERQAARDPDGELTFRAGNIAIHLFSLSLLRRLSEGEFELAHHIARKKVPCVGEDGQVVAPDEPNGIKFETFIFDLLPEAEGHVAFEIDRAEEFEPLKNAEGAYSPQTVQAALQARAERWLKAAGQSPQEGVAYEISPLLALDPGELEGKLGELPKPREGKVYLH